MNTTNLITLALGVSTILASGITSAIVTSWLNRRKDQAEFMRTKAEALYLAADEYGRALAIYSIPFYPVIKGEMRWNQMRDMQNEHGSKKAQHGGHETMTMLAEIYFPSVRPALAAVVQARTSFNGFASEMERAYRADGQLDSFVWMPRMNERTAAIDTSIKALEAASSRQHGPTQACGNNRREYGSRRGYPQG